MLPAALQQSIKSRIETVTNSSLPALSFQPVSGGSINDTYRVAVDKNQSYFLKVNNAATYPQLFEKESNGLGRLQQAGITVPQIIDRGICNSYQFLLLEWIPGRSPNETFWKQMGAQLAALHHHTHTRFGLEEDNYMGSVPQANAQHTNWVTFFSTRRLQPLVIQCRNKGLLTREQVTAIEQVYKQLPNVFSEEPPALLHGDLWSGNFMCSEAMEPVLIDPAVYYGHRSVDLGLTTLFGGFSPPFYEAYHYHFPLPDNYQLQWQVCNLYPLLIHLLLFGTGYLPSINNTLQLFQ